MKILHVTKKYPNALGGDAIVVQNLEKQQKKNGHEVFILTTNCDEIINKPNLIKFGLKDTSSGLDEITFKRIICLIILFFQSFIILKKIKPDVVHSHLTAFGYILSFACKLYKIPLVNTCHGVYFSHKEMGLLRSSSEKFFLKNSGFKKIFTVDLNSLEDFKKIGVKNAIYIPNGVNLEKVHKTSKKNKNKIIALFVGRLDNDKGLKYLIEARKIISNKNLEIQIIGGGVEKEYLKELTSRLYLNSYVKFLGKKMPQEIKKYYLNSDMFILPSIWEGFPLTILEAWGASLPIIVTNVGGISKVCTNNKDSLIIKPKNPKAIADAIKKIIKNPKFAKKLGENGRKLVEQKYNWKIINKQIEEEYKK